MLTHTWIKELVVEWARNGGKRPNENECFNCGREGKFRLSYQSTCYS